MKNKLIPATRVRKAPTAALKESPPGCSEPTEDQLLAADRIVAGIPPAAALLAMGVSSPPAAVLKGGAMRAALRLAIEKALLEQGKLPDIDKMAAGALVEGMGAVRPVVLGKSTVIDYPDYATRGAFLDRVLKLTGDLARTGDDDLGGAWDALVLRMRRPVLGA